MRFIAIDHVQLAMPKGEEAAARAFYGGVLRLEEIPKPEVLASRGGVWFGSADVQVHLGVDPEFRPARKAHPAFRVQGLGELAERLQAAGYEPRFDHHLPGCSRFYVDDDFGNRLEFLEPQP